VDRHNVGRVSCWIGQARERSGLPVRRVLARLGVAPSSFYRVRVHNRAGAAETGIGRAVDYYNHERRHSALEYLRPVDCYRGDPAACWPSAGSGSRLPGTNGGGST